MNRYLCLFASPIAGTGPRYDDYCTLYLFAFKLDQELESKLFCLMYLFCTDSSCDLLQIVRKLSAALDWNARALVGSCFFCREYSCFGIENLRER